MARAKKKHKNEKTREQIYFEQGQAIINRHPLFSRLTGQISAVKNRDIGKQTAALVFRDGTICLNQEYLLLPSEWAYVTAHCILHRAFGHFDAEQMPGMETVDDEGNKRRRVECDEKLWNIACDIFIAKFLDDIKFAKPTVPSIVSYYSGSVADELSIYESLLETGFSPECQVFGVGAPGRMDMIGIDEPVVYEDGRKNEYIEQFAYALAASVHSAVSMAGSSDYIIEETNEAKEAAKWFVNHYPLLGGLASGFHIFYDYEICRKHEISIAAVDVSSAEIYVNPAAGLGAEELKFVLAHEYLHAGLEHYERCQGRDIYLWNVACDFVINGWLKLMQIGEMPKRGILYDSEFENVSAEEVYDRIVGDIRSFLKADTLRGYGKSDIVGDRDVRFGNSHRAIGLDEFYRNALQNGLEYHNRSGRGLIPAGLEEEIRALSMPPVPWDVKLAKWFDMHFAPIERKRTYARPSRRQGSTPDIPRPRMVTDERLEKDRTFGVVIDTSGSMSAKQIGYALGAVASYSVAREVPLARVVFCDACAYDAGYLAPVDIAGRVIVKGRGGTVLQPAVDMITEARDFPKDGPILLITDGMIESHLKVSRVHAYIIPSGNRLPFKAKGEVFYVKEMKEQEG